MTNTINAPMWDQMQVFCKHITDHQIRLILHFDKTLDEEILENAAKITIDNNPIVCTNYLESKKRPLWKFSEISIGEIYTVQRCLEPEHLIDSAILKQINTFTGPQMKISLIRSTTDTLVLNCNHAITDAAGVKGFIYQLAHNYSQLFQSKVVQKKSYTPLRSLKLLSNKLGRKEKRAVLRTMFSNKKSAPTFEKRMTLNNLANPGFKTHTINSSEFEQIKEFGKEYSATVNDMLLTIYYFTLKKLFTNSNKTNRITYSSDLRGYLDETNYDIFSNFSAIHNIDINNKLSDFVSLLKEISALTRKRKQLKYNLSDFPVMAFLFKTVPYRKLKNIFHKEFDKIMVGKLNAAPSLSNAGVIEESKVHFGTMIPTEAYLFGGINHPSLLQLVVSTYMKRMTISVGSYCNEKNSHFIQSFIEELKVTVNKEILKCSFDNVSLI